MSCTFCSDGAGQALAGCQKDFRNRPYPVKLRIQYYQNVVTVMVHDGMQQHDRFELCIRSENIVLPRNGWMGISAATGGLADDHDILAFSALSIFSGEAAKAVRLFCLAMLIMHYYFNLLHNNF